jgi:hypothetical protein
MDPARSRLMQDPIWMTTLDGLDFEATGEPIGTPLGSLRTQPGALPGTVRFAGGGLYLSAGPAQRDLTLEPDDGPALQGFLLIRPDDLADIRQLLNHSWRLLPSRRPLGKADIRLIQGFKLMLGSVLLDLTTSLPLGSPTRRPPLRGGGYMAPSNFVLRAGDPEASFIELAEPGMVQAEAPSTDIELTDWGYDPTERVAEERTLASAANARIDLEEAVPGYAPPPVVITARDRDLFARAMLPGGAASALAGAASQLRREADRYVCLARGAEGVVFDAEGRGLNLSHLAGGAALPAGFDARGGKLWMDRALMEKAPRLQGTYAVFYDRCLDNLDYYMPGSIPALYALLRQMPDAIMLLPAGLSRIRSTATLFDHREVLAAAGFARVKVVDNPAALVRVEDLIYLDRPVPAALPGPVLERCRDHVLQLFDGRGEAVRRLYLRPKNSGPPRQAMERFLLSQGFEPVQLDHMPTGRQIDLFRTASFVVGSYGAGLGNILFSTRGLRVLELMDERVFEPFIWRLAGKLGHIYGFLGCAGPAVNDGNFKGLFNTLEAFAL